MKKLLLLLFLSSAQLAQAQIFAGALSYEHVSGYTFRIQVKTWSPSFVSSWDQCGLLLCFGDGDSAIAPCVNGPSTLCPAAHDGVILPINCPDVLKYNVFEVEHTYSGPNTFHLYVQNLYRFGGISNIASSSATKIYLDAELVINPFLVANNSPVVTAASLPLCDCTNTPLNFNPGLTDPDGDSLYYKNPLSGLPGYTDPGPAGEFSINGLSGDVTWNAPHTAGSFVYDLQVEEWRLLTPGARYFVGSSSMEVWNEIRTCAGIGEPEGMAAHISIFPNPAAAIVNITVDGNGQRESELRITNAIGQTVRSFRISGYTSLAISGLPAGMYFYTLGTAEMITGKGKFIVAD